MTDQEVFKGLMELKEDWAEMERKPCNIAARKAAEEASMIHYYWNFGEGKGKDWCRVCEQVFDISDLDEYENIVCCHSCHISKLRNEIRHVYEKNELEGIGYEG